MTATLVETDPHHEEQEHNLERFRAWMLATDCRERQADEQSVVKNPVAQELIHNDGSRTYAVHSATHMAAPRIMETGFTFRSMTNEPNLEATAFMLESTDGSLPQERTNELLLDYRRDTPGMPRAKIIMEFPFERPSTKGDRVFNAAGQAPFDRTPLNQAGQYIQRLGEPLEQGFDMEQQFRIPRTYIKGWFDLDTGDFHPNPHFGEHERRTLRQKLKLGLQALRFSRRPQ